MTTTRAVAALLLLCACESAQPRELGPLTYTSYTVPIVPPDDAGAVEASVLTETDRFMAVRRFRTPLYRVGRYGIWYLDYTLSGEPSGVVTLCFISGSCVPVTSCYAVGGRPIPFWNSSEDAGNAFALLDTALLEEAAVSGMSLRLYPHRELTVPAAVASGFRAALARAIASHATELASIPGK